MCDIGEAIWGASGLPGDIGHQLLGDELFFGDEDVPPTLEGRISSLTNDQLVQSLATLRTLNRIYPDILEYTTRAAGDYGALFRSEAEKARAGELAAFRRYAGEYVGAVEEADPEQARLLRGLMEQAGGTLGSANRFLQSAEEELGYGSQLSPRMLRDVQQNVRAGQSARGLGYGPSDVFDEALQTTIEGENLLQRRQGRYLGALSGVGGAQQGVAQAIGARQRVVGDPFLAITGRQSQPQGSNIMAPDANIPGGDLFSYGINREIQDRNLDAARDAARMQLIGSIIQGVLGAAGGAAGAS